MQAHEIEYKLYGDDMQFVEIELDPKESWRNDDDGRLHRNGNNLRRRFWTI